MCGPGSAVAPGSTVLSPFAQTKHVKTWSIDPNFPRKLIPLHVVPKRGLHVGLNVLFDYKLVKNTVMSGDIRRNAVRKYGRLSLIHI